MTVFLVLGFVGLQAKTTVTSLEGYQRAQALELAKQALALLSVSTVPKPQAERIRLRMALLRAETMRLEGQLEPIEVEAMGESIERRLGKRAAARARRLSHG